MGPAATSHVIATVGAIRWRKVARAQDTLSHFDVRLRRGLGIAFSFTALVHHVHACTIADMDTYEDGAICFCLVVATVCGRDCCVVSSLPATVAVEAQRRGL